MKFTPLPLQGTYLIELEPHFDERGYFARTFCKEEFRKKGIQAHYPQWSLSSNNLAGTVRGLHYQGATGEEEKLIQCISGKVFDVFLDIRKTSPTYGKTYSCVLDGPESMLYLPQGFAHGFQSLENKTRLNYFISKKYNKFNNFGINPFDPYLDIKWPIKNIIVGENDKKNPNF